MFSTVAKVLVELLHTNCYCIKKIYIEFLFKNDLKLINIDLKL